MKKLLPLMKTDEDYKQLKWGDSYKLPDGNIGRYFRPHPGQLAILQSKARYLALIAGKYGGKTSFAPLWLSTEIEKKPKGTFVLCAPSLKIVQEAVLPEWHKFVQGTALQGEYKEQKGLYILPSGGLVYIRSLDDSTSIEGLHANAAVVDEGLNLPLNAWHILRSRTAGKLGRILITSTPYRKYSWPEREIIQRWKSGDPDYFCVQYSSLMNPAFDKQEFEKQRELLPPHEFEMNFEGIYSKPSGLVFPDYEKCLCDIPEGGIPKGAYVGGIDFGFGGADHTCALAGVLDKNDVLWLFYEFYKRANNVNETALALKTWHNEFYRATGHSILWHCDHSPGQISVLRNYRISSEDKCPSLDTRKCYKGAGSVNFSIGLLNSRIRTGRLKIIKSAVKALPHELSIFSYDTDKDGEAKEKTTGADHAISAARYLCQLLYRRYKS
jgi:hypothetical protein